LILLGALAGNACDKESSCRPGTAFVHVDPGSYVTANEVGIDVSIEGGSPTHTALVIPTGSRGGGVEVQFPGGYPAGKSVAITVTLSASGTTLASRRVDRVLGGDCAVFDVNFRTVDGGQGGSGGASAGRGGNGGAAGDGGTSGTVGTAGTGGSAGGAAGTGGATAGTGGGGAAGTGGGPAGRGGAGGGAAGRGGTGAWRALAAVGGTRWRGRHGGHRRRAGRGGTGGTCVPTGAENCFNSLDDDCDGRVDCADTDCGPVAQCVPLDPTGGRVGVVVAATASCPTGYTDLTAIFSGLGAGACTGCTCRPPTLSCSATIASFGTAAACASTSTVGTAEGSLASTQTCTTPSWVGSMFGTIFGVQAGTFTPTLTGSCVAQGTPALGPVTWAMSSRFCATATVGGGCATGQACVPVLTATKCTMFDGSHACQTGTTASSWNTGATDSRTCGACTCGGATGHSCTPMRIQVGTDYTCAPTSRPRCPAASASATAPRASTRPGSCSRDADAADLPGERADERRAFAHRSKTLCCM